MSRGRQWQRGSRAAQDHELGAQRSIVAVVLHRPVEHSEDNVELSGESW